MGPLLLCNTPLSKVIGKHSGIKFHSMLMIHNYLLTCLKNTTFAELRSCFLDVQYSMCFCKIKLNPDKTEKIMFGSLTQLKSLDSHFPVNILHNFLHPAYKVRKPEFGSMPTVLLQPCVQHLWSCLCKFEI